MLFFDILFLIYAQDIEIKTLNDIMQPLSPEAKTFSLVAFIFLVLLLSSLIQKAWLRHKRKQKGTTVA